MLRLPLLLLLGFLSGVAYGDPVYQVTFNAVTAFGDTVPVHVVVLADPLHHRDLASHCAGGACKDIPEGPYSYTVTIDASGRKVEGSAVIYRKNQVIPVDVGTPVADMDDSAFPTIPGKIIHASDTSGVWIRLQQLYSDSSVSARVEADGNFQLDQVRPGNWMLLVLRGGTLVHFEPYTCKETGNAPLKLDLTQSQPIIKVRTQHSPNTGDSTPTLPAAMVLR